MQRVGSTGNVTLAVTPDVASLAGSFSASSTRERDMKIKGDTRLYVVGREGVSAMTRAEVASAFRGGMTADEVTVCTDRASPR
jgi:hypothetical protein